MARDALAACRCRRRRGRGRLRGRRRAARGDDLRPRGQRDDRGVRAGRRAHRLVRADAGAAATRSTCVSPREPAPGDAAAAGRRAQRHLPLGRRLHAGVARARRRATSLWTLREDSRRSRSTTSSAPASGSASARSAASRRSRTRTTAPASGSAASSGDGATLVYGVTAVDYVDEAGCLAGTGSCEMKIAGGGVYRTSGRQAPKLIAGHGRRRVEVAASGRPSRTSRPRGRRRTAARRGRRPADRGRRRRDRRVDRDASAAGNAARDRARAARPRDARAHAARAAARVVRPRDRRSRTARCRCRQDEPDAQRDRPHGRLPRRALDPSRRHRDGTASRTLAQAAAATPIGLSLEGNRLAWAENLKTARASARYARSRLSRDRLELFELDARGEPRASRGSNRPGPSSTTDAAAQPTPGAAPRRTAAR